MARTLPLVALTVLSALLTGPVEAGPARATAQPPANAAIRARQAVMDDFNARMGRLDALMGVPAVRGAGSRSAEAGR